MTEALADLFVALVFCLVGGAPWWAAVILFLLLRLMWRTKKTHDLVNNLIIGIWSARDDVEDDDERVHVIRDCTRAPGHDGPCNGWRTPVCEPPPEVS